MRNLARVPKIEWKRVLKAARTGLQFGQYTFSSINFFSSEPVATGDACSERMIRPSESIERRDEAVSPGNSSAGQISSSSAKDVHTREGEIGEFCFTCSETPEDPLDEMENAKNES
jgi:hypothetical protein